MSDGFGSDHNQIRVGNVTDSRCHNSVGKYSDARATSVYGARPGYVKCVVQNAFGV